LRASASEQDLYIASVDFDTGRVTGSPVSPVDRYVGTNRSPAWSPDGKHLAYVSLRNRVGTNQKPFLLIYSLETGQTRELDVPQLNYFQLPEWEPDGRSLLARGGHVNGKDGIHRIDVLTGAAETIAGAGIGVQESADGKLYYRTLESGTSENAFMELDLKSGAQREIFKGRRIGFPKVSPDGRTLATTIDDLSRPVSTLVLIPVDGGPRRELAHLSGPQPDAALAWTPNGRGLGVKQVIEGGKKEELWVIPIDGSAHRKIDLAGPFGDQFAVHPDGHRFAYLAGERKGEVWVLENFLSAMAEPTASGGRR
jgi:Tol biopolymer transport system component